jgi:hypothetical protein
MVWGFCYLRIFKKIHSISGRSLQIFISPLLILRPQDTCAWSRLFHLLHGSYATASRVEKEAVK